MSSIWVIEKHSLAPAASAAQALMGDFAVRRIASLRSLALLLRLHRSRRPQLIMVDLDDVGLEAQELSQSIINLVSDIPVLLLSSAPDVIQMNDTAHPLFFRCSKPTDSLELVSLVDSLLRSHRGKATLKYRDVVLDYERFQCHIDPGGERQSLPLKEAQLLRLLLERPGICLTRKEIGSLIWEGIKVSPRTIDSHVSRLRKRLLGAEVTIESVYGGGYILK